MASFVIDEALPESLAEALRAAGHEATHIREVGMRGAADELVFAYAQGEGAVLVTPDLDFADARKITRGQPGVIVVRMPSTMHHSTLTNEVLRAVANIDEAELAGNVLILEPGRMRMRSGDA